MKKLILSGIILFVASAAFCQNSNIDVQHYHYLITLSKKNDTLRGTAYITFVANEDHPLISIDLYGLNKDGKGMLVNKTSFDTYHSPPSPFKQQDNHVIVASSEKKGDTGCLVIFYKGIPDDGLIISKNKYGDKTFFADNWPNRAHHWIPCIDRPDDKASFEFTVWAPHAYSVVSNGVKTEEKYIGDEEKLTHWKEDIALPTKVMVIGVAKFAVKTYTDSPTGIPVSAWVYQQDSVPGFRNYSVAPSILKFMIDYIGPYPYEKLANVQSKTIFGGMENASAIFYEETSAALYQNVESLLAHEIVHQWFGDMASEKSFPHLWLSEGFATYLTHIYIESKYGTDSLNNEMKNDRDAIIGFVKESSKPVVDSISPLMDLLNANSYQKGGWVLHMLRRQLGDSVFHSIIRKYYAAYAGKNADTRDFEKICEAESGQDLRYFFDQWLYKPGIPKLELTWHFEKRTQSVIIKTKQLQSDVFQFPLEIQLRYIHGKPGTESIKVSRREQEFRLPVKVQPVTIAADPNTSMLFTGSVQKVK